MIVPGGRSSWPLNETPSHPVPVCSSNLSYPSGLETPHWCVPTVGSLPTHVVHFHTHPISPLTSLSPQHSPYFKHSRSLQIFCPLLLGSGKWVTAVDMSEVVQGLWTKTVSPVDCIIPCVRWTWKWWVNSSEHGLSGSDDLFFLSRPSVACLLWFRQGPEAGGGGLDDMMVELVPGVQPLLLLRPSGLDSCSDGATSTAAGLCRGRSPVS